MSFTRAEFATDLCHQAGNGNPNQSLIDFIVGWSKQETNTNSGARYNLLNTTQPGIEGSTNFNSVGVKNFPTYISGLQATLITIQNGNYPEIADAIHSNKTMSDTPDTEILKELHTWSGNPSGYGEGLVSLGSTSLSDDFEYGTSPFDNPTPAFAASPVQIDEANERWKSFVPDAPMGTGIYQSWLEEWCRNIRYMGPPLEHERSGHNWQNNPIVYQTFAHATCEWDGTAHWFSANGPIN